MGEHETAASPGALPPVCVVGAGPVGLTLAAVFSARAPTTLLVKPNHRSALLDKTITVSGARHLTVPPRTIGLLLPDEIAALPSDTEYWICVKAYDLDRALGLIAPTLQPTNTVAVLANGLGIFLQAAQTIRRTAPLVRVLPSFGALCPSPTEVVLAGEIITTVAAPVGAEEARDAIVRRLGTVGPGPTVEANVALAEWRKAAINLIVNPVCALAGTTNGALLTDPGLNTLIAPLIREIVAVAAAEGFDLSDLSAASFANRIAPHATNTNSLLVDRQRGRPTEIDYITGRFLQIAAAYDIPTPLNRSLYELLKQTKG